MDTKPIERAWDSYRRTVIPQDAPDIQIRECRLAFYAGASILFEAILGSLDAGDEPTESDMQRMASIQSEIDAFGQEIDKKVFGLKEH